MLAAKLNNTHSAEIGFFWLKSVKVWMIARLAGDLKKCPTPYSCEGVRHLLLFSPERLTMPGF
jgi:hypothetical protein